MKTCLNALIGLIIKTLKPVVITLLLVGPIQAAEQIVMIVNAKSSVSTLTRKQVANLYLGRPLQGNADITLMPLEQNDETARSAFYMALINKPPHMVDAYWARLYFAGRQSPPRRLSGDEAVLTQVIRQPNNVGYINANVAAKDDRVRVVLRLTAE